jgi:hypothetical protein
MLQPPLKKFRDRFFSHIHDTACHDMSIKNRKINDIKRLQESQQFASAEIRRRNSSRILTSSVFIHAVRRSGGSGRGYQEALAKPH